MCAVSLSGAQARPCCSQTVGDDSAGPTKASSHRKVTASRENLTLDARFTIAAQLREQASSRQSQGRDVLLAKKRGLASPAAASPAAQVGRMTCMLENM